MVMNVNEYPLPH